MDSNKQIQPLEISMLSRGFVMSLCRKGADKGQN
jgi:hypothetical protein|nr:MAG TPA: hypothetical protein [Caudoviricetes sp.]DAX93998.1 MAG TPA: hypothetical protein [Caudoviricetes sp.]